MAVNQLNPPIPLHVLGKGDGLAIAVIDYGPDYDLLWVTIINETGEVWTANNQKVRGVKNWSIGRGISRTPSGSKASGWRDWKMIPNTESDLSLNALPADSGAAQRLKQK